jgi:hypothetical protein
MLCVGAAGAQTSGSAHPPVLLIGREQADNGSSGGLIGMMTASSMTNAAKKRSQNFRTTLDDPDFMAEARRIFGCFAIVGACDAPPALTDKFTFDSAVQKSAGQQGFIVAFVPEMTAEQVLLRATAWRVTRANDVSGTPIRTGRGFMAVYSTRVPRNLLDGAENRQAVTGAYWSDGEPRRIVADARNGLAEVNALFAILLRDGTDNGSLPEAWKALPPLPKPVSENPRFRCTKKYCSMIRILEDRGDSVIFVGNNGNQAGWFDAAAAAHQSDLFFIATQDIFWN